MTDYAIDQLKAAREPARPAAPAPRARLHRVDVPFDEHRAVIAGRQPGRLDHDKPAWAAGDHVSVHTATLPDDRRSEDPTVLTVTAMVPAMVCDLAADHARRLGLRLATEVQRVALGLPLETPAAQVNMLARSSQQTVWLTSWTRVESDPVRILRNAGWQVPDGVLRWRPLDAGEQVAAEYQRTLCGRAEPGIEAARERQAARNVKRLATSKAKRTVAHRESTRRRRIDTARTENSRVVEREDVLAPAVLSHIVTEVNRRLVDPYPNATTPFPEEHAA